MANRDDILNELAGLGSELPPKETRNPFQVPEGYFDGLAESVLAKIKNDSRVSPTDEIKNLSPLLAGISKGMPYSVPENYFQSNLESIGSVYQDNESPVLSYIGKELPYSVPYDYFNELPDQINARIQSGHIKEPVLVNADTNETGAKVIPLFSRKWTRIAVVAVLTALIGFTGYNYLVDSRTQQPVYVVKTDSLNKQSSDAIAKNSTSIAKELKDISTQELDAFIKNVDVPPAKPSVAKTTKTDKVKESLKDISDRELERFLDQIPIVDEDVLEIN